MKMKSILRTYALVAAMAAPAAANAAIITTTYGGTISDASMPNPNYDYADTFGLFGPAGASLAGDAITVVYTTNDATLGVDYTASGILGFGAGNPVTAVVTINDVSQTFSPPGADGFLNVGTPTVITTYTNVASIPGLADEDVFASVTDPADLTPAADIHDAFSYACTSSTCVGYGYLQFDQGIFPNDTFIEIPIDITSVSNSSSGVPTPVPPPPSGAPEPATWAMFILGLGLTGFALRRRGALAST
jgi:hypothetical protein